MEYKLSKKGIVIKKRIKPKTFISLILGSIFVFTIIYIKNNFSYVNLTALIIINYYILLVIIKFIIEIKITYQVKPNITYENKKICIKLDRIDLLNLNYKNCFICLESYINNKKVWKQKEKSHNICFIPSKITEMKTNIKFWILKVEIPYKIFKKEIKLNLRYKIII